MTPQQPTEGFAPRRGATAGFDEVIQMTFLDPYRTIIVEPISVPREPSPAEQPAPKEAPDPDRAPEKEPAGEPEPVGRRPAIGLRR